MNKKTIYPNKNGNYFLANGEFAGGKKKSISRLRGEKDFSLSTQFSEIEDIESFINIETNGILTDWLQTLKGWLGIKPETEKVKVKKFVQLLENEVITFQQLLMQYLALMGDLFLAINKPDFKKHGELMTKLTTNRRKFIIRMNLFKFTEEEITKWYSPVKDNSLFKHFTITVVKLIQDYDHQDDTWRANQLVMEQDITQIGSFWESLVKNRSYKEIEIIKMEQWGDKEYYKNPKKITNIMWSGIFQCIWVYGHQLSKVLKNLSPNENAEIWSQNFPYVKVGTDDKSEEFEETAHACLEVASLIGSLLDSLEIPQ